MNYQNQSQKKEFQSTQESLHWISYNLRAIVKELQRIIPDQGQKQPYPNKHKSNDDEIPF